MSGKSLMDVLAEHEWECAEAARDEAIARVEANANASWKAIAEQVVLQLAANVSEFTTDDVWDLVDKTGMVTHERRAMGAVMRRVAQQGAVRKTDRVVNSRRRECHARPVAVWQSMLIGGAA